VGTIGVEPAAFNVIPGACTFSVDLRAADPEVFAEMETLTHALIARIASEEGLEASTEVLDRDEPIIFDGRVVEHLEHAAADECATSTRMTSGAGHDAMVLAPYVPAAMLFVRSDAGISHSPLEHSSQRDCELGANVLARALESIAADPALA
jgi:N-carbamoyl-L-amino-acid hydrolase